MKEKKLPVHRLAECALLIALQIVLRRILSVDWIPGILVGLSFLPIALCAMLFGPWWAAACYAIGDIVGYLLKPQGNFMPGFTITCALMGICYGLFLYRKQKLRFFPDILAPSVINTCLLGLFLNSLWMTCVYTSRGFAGWVVYRLPQEAVTLVLHILLLPLLEKLAAALRKANLI